jgi:predicted LPLAT superfamily acyltransferase
MEDTLLTTLEDRKKIKDRIIKHEENKKNKNQLKDFNFLSANLSRFMPHIQVEEHWDIYINVLYSIHLREFDLNNLLSLTDQLSNDSDKMIGEPKIYVTCHLGFCKASISLLILKGVGKIALIVDNNTYVKQAESILAIHDKFSEKFQLKTSFKIVDVEKSNTIVEMMQLIKDGYSLFAYIDGNSGYKGVYNKERTTEISFLGNTIESRTGLSAISYFTKTPIVPMVSYYNEKYYPVTEFLEPLQLNGENIKEYMERTTKKLYSIFEMYIGKYYDQWESWFYFHKYLDEKILLSSKSCLVYENITKDDFENNKLGIFKIDEDSFLFNKKEYIVYPISTQQFESLKVIQS